MKNKRELDLTAKVKDFHDSEILRIDFLLPEDAIEILIKLVPFDSSKDEEVECVRIRITQIKQLCLEDWNAQSVLFNLNVKRIEQDSGGLNRFFPAVYRVEFDGSVGLSGVIVGETLQAWIQSDTD